MGINLALALKDSKKCCYKYSNKRWNKENLCPCLDSKVNSSGKDEKRCKVLGNFFASVFSDKTGCLLDTQPSELEERDGKQNEALHNAKEHG